MKYISFPIENGFPRPDWNLIHDEADKLTEDQRPDEWMKLSRRWVEEIASSLSSEYRIQEAEEFYLVCAESDRYCKLLLDSFERARKYILRNLRGIANDEGYGKHVALVFSDQETYYQYISHFYPDDGEFSLSAGLYVNRGYGHFVFPFLEMYDAEATAAHELTHACLSHLSIPAWLNEGLAVSIEDNLCGTFPLHMTKERITKHKEFWNTVTIQEFWSGESFGRTDEGSNLSYELARYCVKSLSHNYDDFTAFANSANYEDAGEAAAIKIYGGSLGGLLEQFFGLSDCQPQSI